MVVVFWGFTQPCGVAITGSHISQANKGAPKVDDSDDVRGMDRELMYARNGGGSGVPEEEWLWTAV